MQKKINDKKARASSGKKTSLRSALCPGRPSIRTLGVRRCAPGEERKDWGAAEPGVLTELRVHQEGLKGAAGVKVVPAGLRGAAVPGDAYAIGASGGADKAKRNGEGRKCPQIKGGRAAGIGGAKGATGQRQRAVGGPGRESQVGMTGAGAAAGGGRREEGRGEISLSLSPRGKGEVETRPAAGAAITVWAAEFSWCLSGSCDNGARPRERSGRSAQALRVASRGPPPCTVYASSPDSAPRAGAGPTALGL